MSKQTTTLYQHGTLALLIPGLYDGTQTIAEVLKHGDYGIGTAHALGGEMIVLDGKAYLALSTGEIKQLAPETVTPFATVHFNDETLAKQTVKELTFKELQAAILNKHAYQNVFFAVTLTGCFSYMKTRAVAEQQKPYPPLVDVADQQSIFEEHETRGTVVGYYAPALFEGMAVAGFHVHYLDQQHQMGGHILDFKIKEAQLTLQPFENVAQHFPITNPDFMQAQIDLTSLANQIRQAES